MRKLDALKIGATAFCKCRSDGSSNVRRQGAVPEPHGVFEKKLLRLDMVTSRHDSDASSARSVIGAVVGPVAAVPHVPLSDQIPARYQDQPRTRAPRDRDLYGPDRNMEFRRPHLGGATAGVAGGGAGSGEFLDAQLIPITEPLLSPDLQLRVGCCRSRPTPHHSAGAGCRSGRRGRPGRAPAGPESRPRRSAGARPGRRRT